MRPQSRPRQYDLAYILNSEPSLGSSRRIHQNPHVLIQSADAVDSAVTGEERRYRSLASSEETDSYDLSHELYLRKQPSLPAHRLSPLAPVPVHERDTSNQNHRVAHPIQTPPLSYHNLPVYNQIPDSMSCVTIEPSAVASEAHQQRA